MRHFVPRTSSPFFSFRFLSSSSVLIDIAPNRNCSKKRIFNTLHSHNLIAWSPQTAMFRAASKWTQTGISNRRMLMTIKMQRILPSP